MPFPLLVTQGTGRLLLGAFEILNFKYVQTEAYHQCLPEASGYILKSWTKCKFLWLCFKGHHIWSLIQHCTAPPEALSPTVHKTCRCSVHALFLSPLLFLNHTPALKVLSDLSEKISRLCKPTFSLGLSYLLIPLLFELHYWLIVFVGTGLHYN